ncbi:MAG: hypothetical protein JSU70_13695 [Phycisphaerales bacterium]|nr:MAG: hypothetical protein JSU70_13695 [Phycisphaerales bacterium]
MKKTDPKALIDLDQCVLNALEFFASPRGRLPELKLDEFGRPLVVGSGNAAAAGKIVFADQDAVFADESGYRQALQTVKSIDGVVLFSASGGKHAPVIAKYLGSRGKRLPLWLVTCNKKAKAKKHVDKMIAFPYLPEPYTYNTTTYMGMILAKTGENTGAILRHIKREVDPALRDLPQSLANFDAFMLLVPEKFDLVRIMLTTKFVELFGRRIARDVFTWEQAKHATTVIEADKELFISFGRKNTWWGKHRLHIPLPAGADYGAMMAIGYYVIGKIQAQNLPWFKESIGPFCKNASKLFGQTLKPFVNFK